MPNHTTNLNLAKPLNDEQYDIMVYNENMDKIDTFAGQVPARALTADKLTTGAKINNVLFKGDSDITLPVATSSIAGTVKPDNETIVVDASGKISTATSIDGDYINNSKALETGGVSSNTTIYSDIHTYAHSTFNKSKFTIIGTPNITDDGILTSSASNYVQTAESFNFGSYNTWEIINKVNISSFSSSQQQVFYINQSDLNTIFSDITTSKKVRFIGWRTPSGGAEGMLFKYTSTFTLSENIDYWIICKFTGANYQIGYSTDGQNFTYETASTSTTKCNCNGTLEAGTIRGIFPLLGTTDLKGLTVIADGVEVFNGNKTGIDTIKPDDYTVVGSPTISADGVASGFSDSNYLKKSGLDFRNATEIAFEFQAKLVKEGYQVLLAYGILSPNWIGISGQNKFNFPGGTFDFVDNNTYDIKVYLNTSTAKGYAKYRTITETIYAQTEIGDLTNDQLANFSTLKDLIIGIFSTSGNIFPFTTPFDLNTLKIYIDGDLVYQPCLKIPYTKSKTGSKVVDVYARPRVASMYEQFGIAPYYTIDETNQNFTLPMGEIYGMFIEKSSPYIIENYRNGASWYRVWSDGLIEQGGDLILDTSSYTFTKEYTNHARVFIQVYTNNSAAATNEGAWLLTALPTTTGFNCPTSSTYYEGGWWYARGY